MTSLQLRYAVKKQKLNENYVIKLRIDELRNSTTY